MFAYIDETGHTGSNLFDESQPNFITAAFITKSDFDSGLGDRVLNLAQEVGIEQLHGSELSLSSIDLLAPKILQICEEAEARFYVAILEKKYIAACKFVDAVFDPAENLAVPPHRYILRPLRLLLVFKIANILPDQLCKRFWSSLLASDEEAALSGFRECLTELLDYVPELPDEGSRTFISEALNWAIMNYRNIRLHTNSKAARKGHLPNMVAFPLLLGGIDRFAKESGLLVQEIVHDRQSEFQSVLKEWHQLLSEAAPNEIRWPMEEPFSLCKAPGSRFRISSSADSPGIQVIDIVLWLVRRAYERGGIGSGSHGLLRHVVDCGLWSVLSFDAVGGWLNDCLTEVDSLSSSRQDRRRAKKTLAQIERLRQERLRKFVENEVEKGRSAK